MAVHIWADGSVPFTNSQPQSQFSLGRTENNRRRLVREDASLLRGTWIQGNLLFLTSLRVSIACCRRLFATQSPALDAGDWIEHHAADDDAYSHHVERVIIAVGDVVQVTCIGHQQQQTVSTSSPHTNSLSQLSTGGRVTNQY